MLLSKNSKLAILRKREAHIFYQVIAALHLNEEHKLRKERKTISAKDMDESEQI